MLNQIKEDIEATVTAKVLTETFEEVAATRMQAIRGSVSQTRAFLVEVDGVFGRVKRAYQAWLAKHDKDPNVELAKLGIKNGRTAMVLLSASSGLYGDLPLTVTKNFISQYRYKSQSNGAIDVFVVGKVGQYLVGTEQPKITFTALELADDKPTEQEVGALLQAITAYNAIYITYAHFESLLAQVPETADIAGGSLDQSAKHNPTPAASHAEAEEIESIHTIYEPSMAAVVQFFELEITKALLRQKIYEMQLSRFASRMVAMDQATDKTNDQLTILEAQALRMKKQIANHKLQELFAGRSIWE